MDGYTRVWAVTLAATKSRFYSTLNPTHAVVLNMPLLSQQVPLPYEHKEDMFCVRMKFQPLDPINASVGVGECRITQCTRTRVTQLSHVRISTCSHFQIKYPGLSESPSKVCCRDATHSTHDTQAGFRILNYSNRDRVNGPALRTSEHSL